MGITKKINYSNIFIFLFLIIFPFGQILRIGIFHPLDIVVGAGALYAFINKFKKPNIFTYFDNFIFVAFVAWLMSLFVFKSTAVFYGALYLIRLVSYFYFYVYLVNFVNKTKQNKMLLPQALLAVSTVSALFGWIQFFTFPDIKPFFTWGWDEHLYRLVGTFLDPTFLGLIIVFGLLAAIANKKWLLVAFLFISMAFTYSRASFLAFLIGLPFVLSSGQKFKSWAFVAGALVLVALLLPTSRNHSINLFRNFSAIARVENYKTTINIFKKSPVFGVGYNNMCLAYQKYIGPQSFASHACSGSDSSILFILATTGVCGLISFFALLTALFKSFYQNKLFMGIFVSLLVHSIFSNSLFYSWIVGYVLAYLATLSDYKMEN